MRAAVALCAAFIFSYVSMIKYFTFINLFWTYKFQNNISSEFINNVFEGIGKVNDINFINIILNHPENHEFIYVFCKTVKDYPSDYYENDNI